MKPNVGGMDRIGRLVAGIVLLVVGFAAPLSMIWKVAVLIVAAVALVTGIVRFCPANALLGIDTSEAGKK